MKRPLFGPGEIGVRGPMPGIPRGHDPANEDDRAYVAYCEQHGHEPRECVACGALVDELDDNRCCAGCAEDAREKANIPVSADDFGPPCPSVNIEDLPF